MKEIQRIKGRMERQTMSLDPTAEFREVLLHAGLIPGDIIPDGKIHRCATEFRPRSKDGWFVLYLDPPAGAYGDWAKGLSEKWAGNGGEMDHTSWKNISGEIERGRKEREKEEARRHAEAAQIATSTLESLPKADESNPYLTRKCVKPCPGLKADKDVLVVPVLGTDGKPMSLQRIKPDGGKLFLEDGQAKGGFFSIKGDNAKPLYICEGIATGLSVYEATGATVLCAFFAGNLQAVTEMGRSKYPERQIIICADNDFETMGRMGKNPGMEAGVMAARTVGAKIAIPLFKGDRGSDFNDLHVLEGVESVRQCLQAAKETEGGARSRESWPEPIPLPEDLPRVAPFDERLLPPAVKTWVMDISERVQCPPDYVAVGVICALGTVIGRKVGIRPQESTDWTEYSNQWGLLIGRPGVLKSPAMEAALKPLRRLVAEAAREYESERQDYEAAKLAAKLRRTAAEKQAMKELAKNQEADISHLLNHHEEDPPVLRRFITSNSTAEALGELLRVNPNGLLVYRDELVSLLRNLDREEQAEARGFYLTGWAGNSPFTFDRIGRGLNLHIQAVCISLLGSTQPARIAQYVRTALKGGSGDDGMLQRFGLTVWPDTSGHWKEVDRWPDSEARRRAFNVFELLNKLSPKAVGAHQDYDLENLPDGPPYLRYHPEGLGLFREWRQDLETKLRIGDLHPALESHLAKYRKLVPGLALILHLSDSDIGPVTHHAVLQALAWGDYLETHARRLYSSMTAPEVSAAKAILARVRSGSLSTVFAGWQVWRPQWAGLTDRNEVYEGLKLLEDLSWIRREQKETGGRPTIEYHVNPRGVK